MKSIATAVAASMIGLTIGVAMSSSSAYAAAKKKVDCDAVMQEVNSGKGLDEVAKDQGVSKRSVLRCEKKAKSGGASAGNEASPAPSPEAPKP